MANSNTDVCNIALRKLREQPITSLTQDNEPARLCSQFYDDAVDYLLARHPHNFAMTRQQLSQNAAAPAFEWDYAYTLPTDPYCVRAYKLYHNGTWQDDWIVEGRDLLTAHDNTVYLLYVARVTDVVSYPPTFVNALSSFLAHQLAFPLNRDKGYVDQLMRQFERDWREHKNVDGGEGWHDEPDDGIFVSVRE